MFSADLATRAWAGGENGRYVLDRFLPQALELLSPSGLFYCVVIKENLPGCFSISFALWKDNNGCEIHVLQTKSWKICGVSDSKRLLCPLVNAATKSFSF